jgi:hypothetical protein
MGKLIFSHQFLTLLSYQNGTGANSLFILKKQGQNHKVGKQG